MKWLKRISVYLKQYRLNAVLNVVFNIISSFFGVFSVLMLIPFLNLLFHAEPAILPSKPVFEGISEMKSYLSQFAEYFIAKLVHEGGKTQALLYICLCTLGVFLLKNIFRYLALHFLAPMRTGVAGQLRQKLYNKLLDLHVLYFSDQRKGDIMTRLTNDVQEVEYGILHFLEVGFKEPITILVTLFTMIILSPKMTLFVLLILPVSGYIIGKIGKTLKQASKESQQLQGQLNSAVEETISGTRIVKAYTAEKSLTERFSVLNEMHRKIGTRMLRRRDLSTPLSEFLGITIVVMVLFLGGRLVLNHTSTLTPETFITFIVIFAQIIQPAKAFSNAYYFIQKGLASLDRVEELLDEKIVVNDATNAIDLKTFDQSIELKNVSFSYPGRPVLQDINISISKGKKIALVGVSGSGKSTLIQLIMRFFDPSAGEILIDGKNIKAISQNSLRKQIALVTQHAVLFNDSVANNIALGNELNDAKIKDAAQHAYAWDFIQNMPGQWNASVGDNGSKLSGGEQQRLALARAFYKNAPILILDEATAHLDSNSEQLVQKALYELWKDKTAIIIAHRLSTVQNCDEIIVLKDGKVVEQGSPSELMSKNGEYKRLVELQQL